MLYQTFIKRVVCQELREEQRAQVRAIQANSAYLKGEEALRARNDQIKQINQHFDKAIKQIQDPGRHEREMKMLRDNPLMGAGIRNFERLKWDMQANQQAARQIREQAAAGQ